jgi:hypothetical protein
MDPLSLLIGAVIGAVMALSLTQREVIGADGYDPYDQCIECTKCIGHEPGCSLG